MTTSTDRGAPAVGIIGTGGIAGAHAPGWEEAGVTLHVHSLEGAEEFAAAHPATIHEDLDSLLAAVDLVDICTPTPSHAEIAHRALDAGCDVICEKPLARTAEDARAVVEHAREAGRFLFPAHVVRYFPQYATAKAAIDRGGIGRLAVLRFERSGQFPKMPWFADEAASGGIVMDQMIHDIDQAIWMAGPVAHVHATQNQASGDGTVRTAHVVLTHTSGAISHCRGFWGPPGTAFRYTFSLAGDTGRLDYDSAANPSVAWDDVAAADGDAGGFLPDISTLRSPYAEEILDALAAVTTGTVPRVSPEDGALAVEVSLAALESFATGRSVPC